MGGLRNFGAIPVEENEPVFHTGWEARVFATNLAISPHLGGNVDRFRHLIESIPPPEYLNSSYYERWLASVMEACVETGLLSEQELHAINRGDVPEAGPVRTDPIPAALIGDFLIGGKVSPRDFEGTAEFAVGDRVRTRRLQKEGHTRMVGYAQGCDGQVIEDNGNQVLPDDHAMQRGATMQRLYTVRFAATELWGPESNANDSVCIDLWESYLQHVE